MALDKQLLNTDFYHTRGATRKYDINQVRRQLAKAANQRMRRLEKEVSPITGNTYSFGAYDIAQEYLATKDKTRFSEALGLDRDLYDIIREITVLQGFLTSKSSTVRGQRAIEQKRVQTFVSKGIPESVAASKEFYEFLSSSTFTNLSKAFSSETLVEEFDRLAEEGATGEDIMKGFQEFEAQPGRKGFKDLVNTLNAKVLPKSGNS